MSEDTRSLLRTRSTGMALSAIVDTLGPPQPLSGQRSSDDQGVHRLGRTIPGRLESSIRHERAASGEPGDRTATSIEETIRGEYDDHEATLG